MAKLWITLGASSAGIAVILGAFGAHALRDRLTDKMMATYQTSSHYQFIHALALILLGLWVSSHSGTTLSSTTGWCFTLGTLLFCGSLYALAVTDIRVLGAITPLGGISFIIGWTCFALTAWRTPQ